MKKFHLIVLFIFSFALTLMTGCETFYSAFGRSNRVNEAEMRRQMEREQLAQEMRMARTVAQSADEQTQRLDTRMTRVEDSLRDSVDMTGRDIAELKREVQALRHEYETLRENQDKMRDEIVSDIAGKMEKLLVAQQARTAVATTQRAQSGYEHKVQSGQTLSTIAAFYKVPISKIREANPTKIRKGDIIHAGETIFVPDP